MMKERYVRIYINVEIIDIYNIGYSKKGYILFQLGVSSWEN